MHNYDYDNVGNRELADGVIYQPNNLNQYTFVGPQAIVYDDNGNLTNDEHNTYTYDEENRLTTAQNAQHTSSYEYDAFNRRVKKVVDGVETNFIYDGDQVIEERNNTNQLLVDYVLGDQIDEVLLINRGGNTYNYHYDGLGSVTEITNANGQLAERYEYDVYGAPTIFNSANQSIPTSAINNPYMFTGRRWNK